MFTTTFFVAFAAFTAVVGAIGLVALRMRGGEGGRAEGRLDRILDLPDYIGQGEKEK